MVNKVLMPRTRRSSDTQHPSGSRPAAGRPCRPRGTALDFRRKYSYIGVASRVGLTPSPTCQTWARWFPARGCGQFGNETGRTLTVSPPRMKPTEGFLCQNTNRVAEWRSHLLHRRSSVSSWSITRLTNLKSRSAANEQMELIALLQQTRTWTGCVMKDQANPR